uniref:Uncharacterized protein n=1 Tax=Calcidiscus leptoporus TaxID=127549 RepID=A0A7S0NUX8_9EUKA
MYRHGLDGTPPDVLKPRQYMLKESKLLRNLTLKEYPMYLQDKADERNARHPGGQPVKLVASKECLLGKLWDAFDCKGPGGEETVYIDQGLTTSFWKRSDEGRLHDVEQHDGDYKKRWSTRVEEYLKRQKDLHGARGEATPSDDDPYWEAWNLLIDEYKHLLLDNHSPWEREMLPQEFFHEVASLYEVCYEKARKMPGFTGKSRIQFVWRLAGEQLKQMKSKYKRIVEAETLFV